MRSAKRSEWVCIYVDAKDDKQKQAAIKFAKGVCGNYGKIEKADSAKIAGVFAIVCTAFSYSTFVWAQAEEKKALTPEEAAEAQKKLEEAQQKLKRVFKNVPKIDNAGAITGVVTCQKMRNNADAIVFIEKIEGKFNPPAEHAIVDQLNLTYVPRVVAIQKGIVVDFPNSDAVRHNVFSPPGSALQFNLGTYPAGVVKDVLFDVAGETPLLCNVHAEMAGYVVSFENPYFAIAAALICDPK